MAGFENSGAPKSLQDSYKSRDDPQWWWDNKSCESKFPTIMRFFNKLNIENLRSANPNTQLLFPLNLRQLRIRSGPWLNAHLDLCVSSLKWKLESTSWFVLVILVLGKFALPLLMGVSALRNCTDSSCLLLTTGVTRGQNVVSRKMRAILTSVKQTSPSRNRYFLW